ncbi:MAG: C39 family peptidase [Tepidisphaeraceae bacterium]|jgi:hypothetical protein
MRKRLFWAGAVTWGLVCLLSVAAPVGAQALHVVGIPSSRMDGAAAEQHNTHWCWAAAIQTALNSYGVKVAQDQIVRRSYGSDAFGNLPDWAASFDLVTANLSGWAVDQNGTSCRVSCQRGWGAPPAAVLVQALQEGHPVILACVSPLGGAHAVVCTAAAYLDSDQGPNVLSLVVRDPWPGPDWDQTKGRMQYPAALLAYRVSGYWIVNVEKATDQPQPSLGGKVNSLYEN